MWFIYTVEYYSALKKKEMLPYVTAWMNLEEIMLSERTNMACFHLHELSKMVKLIETEGWIVVSRGYGEEELGSHHSLGIKFCYTRWLSSRDLLYNIEPMVNSTVLCMSKLIKLYTLNMSSFYMSIIPQ